MNITIIRLASGAFRAHRLEEAVRKIIAGVLHAIAEIRREHDTRCEDGCVMAIANSESQL